MSAIDLHKTFQEYVSASNAATSVFVDYKLGRATEKQVWAANKRESDAADTHIAAMNAVGVQP